LDWIQHDFDPSVLRRDGTKGGDAGVAGAGTKIDWPSKLQEELAFCIVRSGVTWSLGPSGDFNNFGKSAPAVRHYVSKARGKGNTLGALVGTAEELRRRLTLEVLHNTPLGSGTVAPRRPTLDPFPAETAAPVRSVVVDEESM
jgi:hypothetical protein